jgi:hypothetical protein
MSAGQEGKSKGLQVPYLALATVGLGLLLYAAKAGAHNGLELLGSFVVVGALTVLLGVGGLISVAVRPTAAWRADGSRWALVILGGLALIEPGWGTAAALALALVALALGSGSERRY